MSDQFFWYATRSAGIVCWFAATASVVVGLMMSSRLLGRRPTIPWLLDLHRYLGALSIVFLAIHLVTLHLDPFVAFDVAELIVPGRAAVPGLTSLSLTLGVVSGWILVVVEATSLIKKHLPKQMWHTIHLCSIGTVVAGAIHGIETGSDADNRVLVAAATSVLMASALVGATRVIRFLGDRDHRRELEQNPASRIPAGLDGNDRIPDAARAAAGYAGSAGAGRPDPVERIPAALRRRSAEQERIPAALGQESAEQERIPAVLGQESADRELIPVAGDRTGRSRSGRGRRGRQDPSTQPRPATASGDGWQGEGLPPWATGPVPTMTRGEATWNNGDATFDWSQTLRDEGSWSIDEGPPQPPAYKPSPAAHRPPQPPTPGPARAPAQGPGPVGQRPASGWFDPPDRADQRPDPVGHHPPPGRWDGDRDGQGTPSPLPPRPQPPRPHRRPRPEPGWSGGRAAPEPGPPDGVTPRWGMYRTAEHDLRAGAEGGYGDGYGIEDGYEAEILPFPDPASARSRMSYDEARDTFRGRDDRGWAPGRHP